MSRASRARRIATTAAYGGGGMGLLGALMVGVLRGQARLARHRVGRRVPTEDPPTGNGVWGTADGTPIAFAVLGDSSAVGLGASFPTETPGVLISVALSELADRPVRLRRVAVSGAGSRDLGTQVTLALQDSPDIALIMIGANDVTARVSPRESVRYLSEAVMRLRAADCEVVVATCPDLGTIRPVMQPLRSLGRRWSRQLAAAQTIAVVEAGGRTVSLGSVLGPEFATRPELFSADEFHPSAAGYAAAAAVMLPSIADALGVWPEPEERLHVPFTRDRDRVRPVARAAARAASQPGTEVSATEVRGAQIGPRGRWALSLRRRPASMPTPAEAAEEAVEGQGQRR